MLAREATTCFTLIGVVCPIVSGREASALDAVPAISPDGKEIAFSYQGDIYKVSASGGLATRLTTHPAYDYMPLWSPDGKQIAFVVVRDQGAMDIYIMSAHGGQATRVTTHSLRSLIASALMVSMSTIWLISRTLQSSVLFPLLGSMSSIRCQ